jgi:hypothetical protein
LAGLVTLKPINICIKIKKIILRIVLFKMSICKNNWN